MGNRYQLYSNQAGNSLPFRHLRFVWLKHCCLQNQHPPKYQTGAGYGPASDGKEKVTAELQLHSDQGFQYASQSYFTLTTQYGITPSMSRRANPYDNAMAENFFSILKSECIRLYKPETIHDAQTLIDEYIAFYNHDRIQLNSKLSPIEKRRLFA